MVSHEDLKQYFEYIERNFLAGKYEDCLEDIRHLLWHVLENLKGEEIKKTDCMCCVCPKMSENNKLEPYYTKCEHGK